MSSGRVAQTTIQVQDSVDRIKLSLLLGGRVLMTVEIDVIPPFPNLAVTSRMACVDILVLLLDYP